MRKSGKLIKYFAGVLLGVMIMGLPVSAAEYKVAEVSGVLYTNSDTAVYADADEQTMILPAVEPGLPILVTGITNNGYFRIDLGGQTFYVQGNGLSQTNPATQAVPAAPVSLNSPGAAAGVPGTDAEAVADIYTNVYNILIAQKAVFPEGMSWTNSNYVSWKGGIYGGGYGCAGFAFALSDAAFGNAPAKIHTDFTNVRVGDILRLNNDTHSVIVLEVNADSIIVAEGNYNSSVHWGRKIARTALPGDGNYIMTRY